MRPQLQFLRRVAINSSKTVATAVGPFGVAQLSTGAIPFPSLQPTQAAKIVALTGTILDSNNTGALQFYHAAINLVFTNPAGTNLLIAQSYPYPGAPGIIGGAGFRISAFDLPLLYGTDYADIATSIGGSPGQFLLEMGGDFGSGAGIALNVGMNLSALVELYQLPTSH